MKITNRRAPQTIIAVALAVIATFIPSESEGAQGKVPKKAQLKSRIAQFYRAYAEQEWSEIVELMAPFVRECATPDDLRSAWTKHSESGPKILSWKIAEIKHDDQYLGDFTVDCDGRSGHVDAGAEVAILQVEQEPEGVTSEGEIVLGWVLIDGVWYGVGPPC